MLRQVVMTSRSGFLGIERIPDFRFFYRVTRADTALAIN